jgi:hypothetical protein
MIKFFRKIRSRLLKENQLSRYILYAIGEIFLVVIGILIALQINNWNEGRKNNVKMKEYASALISNIEKDTMDISGSLESVPSSKKEIEGYLDFIKTRDLSTEELKDSLYEVIIRYIVLMPTTTAFDDLKSTGNFNLFHNDLRDRLNDYYTFLNWYASIFNGYSEGQEKERLEQRKYISSSGFYEALNYEIPASQLIQGLKHKHNQVELEYGKIQIIENFGPLVLEKARKLIVQLKKK